MVNNTVLLDCLFQNVIPVSLKSWESWEVISEVGVSASQKALQTKSELMSAGCIAMIPFQLKNKSFKVTRPAENYC